MAWPCPWGGGRWWWSSSPQICWGKTSCAFMKWCLTCLADVSVIYILNLFDGQNNVSFDLLSIFYSSIQGHYSVIVYKNCFKVSFLVSVWRYLNWKKEQILMIRAEAIKTDGNRKPTYSEWRCTCNEAELTMRPPCLTLAPLRDFITVPVRLSWPLCTTQSPRGPVPYCFP